MDTKHEILDDLNIVPNQDPQIGKLILWLIVGTVIALAIMFLLAFSLAYSDITSGDMRDLFGQFADGLEYITETGMVMIGLFTGGSVLYYKTYQSHFAKRPYYAFSVYLVLAVISTFTVLILFYLIGHPARLHLFSLYWITKTGIYVLLYILSVGLFLHLAWASQKYIFIIIGILVSSVMLSLATHYVLRYYF